MSLASFTATDSSLSWVGVGNVEGVLLRAQPDAVPARYAVTPRGGVVGYKLPPLRPTVLNVSQGDTLIMATDGVRSDFAGGFKSYRAPGDNAKAILKEYGKKSDDALVLVVRYLGGNHPTQVSS